MARDISSRAGPMADPISILELLGASALGGLMVVPGALEAGGLLAADVAVQIEAMHPGATQLGADIVQGLAPTLPTNVTQTLVNIIGKIFGW